MFIYLRWTKLKSCSEVSSPEDGLNCRLCAHCMHAFVGVTSSVYALCTGTPITRWVVSAGLGVSFFLCACFLQRDQQPTMDFSRLHTYTPPHCTPDNTGYTYSLRWDYKRPNHSSWFSNASYLSVSSQYTFSAFLWKQRLAVELNLFIAEVCCFCAALIGIFCHYFVVNRMRSLMFGVSSLVQVCMSKCFSEGDMTACRCGSSHVCVYTGFTPGLLQRMPGNMNLNSLKGGTPLILSFIFTCLNHFFFSPVVSVLSLKLFKICCVYQIMCCCTLTVT